MDVLAPYIVDKCLKFVQTIGNEGSDVRFVLLLFDSSGVTNPMSKVYQCSNVGGEGVIASVLRSVLAGISGEVNLEQDEAERQYMRHLLETLPPDSTMH